MTGGIGTSCNSFPAARVPFFFNPVNSTAQIVVESDSLAALLMALKFPRPGC